MKSTVDVLFRTTFDIDAFKKECVAGKFFQNDKIDLTDINYKNLEQLSEYWKINAHMHIK